MWIYFLMWTLQSTKNACIHFAQSTKQHLKYKIHLSFYSTWDIKRWSLYAMNFVCITFSTIIDLTTPSTILAAGNFAFFPFDFSCTKSQSLVCNTTLESSMQWIGWYLRDLIFWQVSPNHACQQLDFQWLCWSNYTLLISTHINSCIENSRRVGGKAYWLLYSQNSLYMKKYWEWTY